MKTKTKKVISAGNQSGSKIGEEVQSDRWVQVPISILGVPCHHVTMAGALGLLEQMIISGRTYHVATANVDFAVQALGDVELRRLLCDADLVLGDGTPLLWASHLLGNALPERVAGSDLMPLLLDKAEAKGWRVFFLGGTEENLAEASVRLRASNPRLQLVGAYSPPFKPLIEMDHEDILLRIRNAHPDILFVAFGCPKQEKWIGMNHQKLGVPVSIGIGASIDFIAGAQRRAPIWMRRAGLEWIFRLVQEPRRLFRRYLTDAGVFSRFLVMQWLRCQGLWSRCQVDLRIFAQSQTGGTVESISLSPRLDLATVREFSSIWQGVVKSRRHLLLNLSQVRFLDSTGLGLLSWLQKTLRGDGRHLVLVAPSQQVVRALATVRLTCCFSTAVDHAGACELVRERERETNVAIVPTAPHQEAEVLWVGDITAINHDCIWTSNLTHLDTIQGRQAAISFNLAAVRFIDSSGVALIARLKREAGKRGIEVRFTHIPPPVRNVLLKHRLKDI